MTPAKFQKELNKLPRLIADSYNHDKEYLKKRIVKILKDSNNTPELRLMRVRAFLKANEFTAERMIKETIKVFDLL